MKAATIAYLIAYNVVQWLGWLALAVLISLHLYQHGGDCRGLVDEVALPMLILHSTTILEFVHAILGISKSGPVPAIMQFSGRSFALFVALAISEVRHEVSVTVFMSAWVALECIRYPFYVASLVGSPLYALTWTRYTAFIPLYPLGYGAEVVAFFAAMGKVWESGQLSFDLLGNTINFYYVLCVYTVVSCFGFFQNYTYMFSQRKKALRKRKTT